MESHNISETNNTQAIVSLLISSFLVITGFSVILPFFPIYANDLLYPIELWGITLGITLQIGIITAASKLMQFFLAPAYGELSDQNGRKPLIVIGMLVYSILMVGYGLVTDFTSFLLLRLIQGIASASVWVVGEALVVDLSSEERVGKNLGYYILSMLAGITLGPFVGYFLFSFFENFLHMNHILSYRYTFLGVGIIALIGTYLIVQFVSDPSFNQSGSKLQNYIASLKLMSIKTIKSPLILWRILKENKQIANVTYYLFYFVAFVNGFRSALILPIAVLFLEHYYKLSPQDIALIIGTTGVLALFGSPIGGRLSDRYGHKRVVWITGVSGGLIMALIALKTSIGIYFLMLIFFLTRFLFSMMQPSFRAFQNTLISEEVRGKEFGIVQSMNNLGSVIGPILGGLIYDLYLTQKISLSSSMSIVGGGYPFIISGVLAIIASLVILVFIDAKNDIEN